jgi:hypothetical protein
MNQQHAGYMPDTPQWDGKIHKPAKPGEGFRWDTADGAQRRAEIERHRRRAAQRRYDEEGVKEPSLIGRIWEEIRYFIFPPGRRP